MAKRIGRIPLRSQVRGLDMSYYAAQKDIQRTLLSVNAANYSELATTSVREKIDMQIRRLNKTAIRWTKTSVPMAYRKSYLVARTRLEILGAKKDIYFNKNRHRHSIDEYIDKTMDDLVKANQSIRLNMATYLYLVRQAVKGLAQIQAFDIRDEAFIADLLDEELRAGATRGHAQRLIMEHLRIQALDGQFINIHGRNYNMRKYADLVAKTRLRHVQTEAVLNSCKEYENDLVEVSAHGTECLICTPYEGNIYSLSGKHPRYPFLDGYPPWHPRCQHNIMPTSEVALRWRDLHREVELPGAPYEELWEKASKYKVEYGAWYDKKGNLLLRRKGTKSSINLTNSEFYKLRLEDLGVSVHTHPVPVSFSGSDLAHYSQMGVTEGHVVTSQGVYKIKPGIGRGGRWPDAGEVKSYWTETYNSLADKYNKEFVKLYDRGVSHLEATQIAYARQAEEAIQVTAKKFNLTYSFEPRGGG